MTKTCPCCGHVTREAKRKPASEPINLGTCSREALFAHYKATAPYEDLRFFREVTWRYPTITAACVQLAELAFLVPEDATQLPQLLLPRADFYRRLTSIQDTWRGLSNRMDREAPAMDDYQWRRRRVQDHILCSQVARERSRFLRWHLHIADVPSEVEWLASCAATVARVAGEIRRKPGRPTGSKNRVAVPAVAFVPF